MISTDTTLTAIVEEFTPSTYIMVILTDKDVEPEAINLNIRASKKYFHKIVNSSLAG